MSDGDRMGGGRQKKRIGDVKKEENIVSHKQTDLLILHFSRMHRMRVEGGRRESALGEKSKTG